MEPQFPNNEVVWSIVVAAFGGLAKYLDKYLRQQETLHFIRLFSTLVVTGFTGWLISELVVSVNHPEWRIMAAGIGGYAGVQIVDEVIAVLKMRFAQGNTVSKSDKKDEKKNS